MRLSPATLVLTEKAEAKAHKMSYSRAHAATDVI